MSNISIEITSCVEWNFLPQAESLSAAIKEKFDVKPELVKGGGGIFTVALNGQFIFNNRSEPCTFPTNERIFEEIENFGSWRIADIMATCLVAVNFGRQNLPIKWPLRSGSPSATAVGGAVWSEGRMNVR